jgi:hypothetical protein
MRATRLYAVLFFLIPELVPAPARAAPVAPAPGAASGARDRGQGAVADRALGEMHQLYGEAFAAADRARRRRETLLLRCLNDRLVLMNAYLKIGEDERQRMQIGAWLGRPALVSDAWKKLARVRALHSALAAETRRCSWMRGLGGVDGKTIVEVEIDPRIPRGDPTVSRLPDRRF